MNHTSLLKSALAASATKPPSGDEPTGHTVRRPGNGKPKPGLLGGESPQPA